MQKKAKNKKLIFFLDFIVANIFVAVFFKIFICLHTKNNSDKDCSFPHPSTPCMDVSKPPFSLRGVHSVQKREEEKTNKQTNNMAV